MSSNPTQPKFGDQGEGVNFPPEDDAEGHRLAVFAEGDQPEGFMALGEGDGRPEGLRSLADADDDTEGHRNLRPFDADGQESFVDGRPGGQPEGFKAMVTDDEDDTEGHRVFLADGGEQDGPESLGRRF